MTPKPATAGTGFSQLYRTVEAKSRSFLAVSSLHAHDAVAERAEDRQAEDLGEEVGDVLGGLDVFDRDLLGADEVAHKHVLVVDVARALADALVLGDADRGLVVLVNGDRRDGEARASQRANEPDQSAASLRERADLSLRRREVNLSLAVWFSSDRPKLRRPVDRVAVVRA